MNKWIGGIGDRRVLCVDTMRIFSCPESAAYALNFDDPNNRKTNIRPSDIITNCNRYIRTIRTGMKFEWYNQYLLEQNIPDFSAKTEFIEVIFPKTNRWRATRHHEGPKKLYDDVRKIYRAVKKTYLVDPTIIGTIMSIPKFLNRIGIERKSSAAFSKHFNIHRTTYKIIFDAEFSYVYSSRNGRDMLAIKLNKFTNIGSNPDPDTDWEITKYFSIHLDRDSIYLKGKKNVSQPVIRIEDLRLFGSISTASRMVGIEKQKIVWCCEGDIPYCKKWAEKHTFRYVKFI